jgi:hypothetical protein
LRCAEKTLMDLRVQSLFSGVRALVLHSLLIGFSPSSAHGDEPQKKPALQVECVNCRDGQPVNPADFKFMSEFMNLLAPGARAIPSAVDCGRLDSFLRSPKAAQALRSSCDRAAGLMARYFVECPQSQPVLAGKTPELTFLQSRALLSLFEAELNSIRRIPPSSLGFREEWELFRRKWTDRARRFPNASRLRPGDLEGFALEERVRRLDEVRELFVAEHEAEKQSRGRYPERLAYTFARLALLEPSLQALKAKNGLMPQSKSIAQALETQLITNWPEIVINPEIIAEAGRVFQLDDEFLFKSRVAYIEAMKNSQVSHLENRKPAEALDQQLRRLGRSMEEVNETLTVRLMDDPKMARIPAYRIERLEQMYLRTRREQIQRMDELLDSIASSATGLAEPAMFGDPYLTAAAEASFRTEDGRAQQAPLLGALACRAQHEFAEKAKATQSARSWQSAGLVGLAILAYSPVGAAATVGAGAFVLGSIAYRGREIADAGRKGAEAERNFYAFHAGLQSLSDVSDSKRQELTTTGMKSVQTRASRSPITETAGAISDVLGFRAGMVSGAAATAAKAGQLAYAAQLAKTARTLNRVDASSDAVYIGGLLTSMQDLEEIPLVLGFRGLNQFGITRDLKKAAPK